MSDLLYIDDALFARMERAVVKVQERMRRSSDALKGAGIPFAVIGGNAVAAWVATRDEAAVRNTRDVDVMIRREDLSRVRQALEAVGFFYRRVAGIDMFLDGPESKAADGVHIVFANERVREENLVPNPDVVTVEHRDVPTLGLEQLLQIKLTAWRDKDRTHLRDLIGVGLIDASWLPRLPESLAARLQALLDDPEG